MRGWDAKAAPNGFKPHVVLRFGQFCRGKKFRSKKADWFFWDQLYFTSQAARATRQKRIDILSISALSLDLHVKNFWSKTKFLKRKNYLKDYPSSKGTQASYVERRIFKIWTRTLQIGGEQSKRKITGGHKLQFYFDHKIASFSAFPWIFRVYKLTGRYILFWLCTYTCVRTYTCGLHIEAK